MVKDLELAIRGGKPARIRENPPFFLGGIMMDEREEQAALDVIRSKRLFRYYGPPGTVSKVAEFEKKFAKVTSVEHALAMNSCTNALVIALLAAGVQPGDEVIVPGYTFIATAAAVVAANAIPVIAEIDDSFTLDPADLEKKITAKTRAVIPVHMRGVPCDMDSIMKIAARHGLKVIEDAAQACGGSFNGMPLGSIGNAGCFSFQYHKIITAGEGGAVATNSRELFERAQSLHDCGANWRGNRIPGRDMPFFPGLNCRMNELSGALLLVQLERRDGMIGRMRAAAAEIGKTAGQFKGVQPRRMNDAGGDIGVCCMFTARDREKAVNIAKALTAEGVDAGTMGGHEIPDWHIYFYWSHILARRGNNDSGFPFSLSGIEYSPDMCPRTCDFLQRVVHLSVSPLYTDEDVAEICFALEKVLSIMA
jgi:8-amino-3,8-dideoxy-alpha-D-manno-octulosonate transaminase